MATCIKEGVAAFRPLAGPFIQADLPRLPETGANWNVAGTVFYWPTVGRRFPGVAPWITTLRHTSEKEQ